MRIYTPEGLAYPITVTKLYCKAGDSIEQNARLFSYEYKSWVTEGKEGTLEDKEGREVQRSFYSDFEVEYEGQLVSLTVSKGQVINGKTAIGELEENCRHEVQFGGMCANCGKDMTLVTSYNATEDYTERAKINTVHSNTNLLVSQAEASRADDEAKRRLLDSRKLILVVDLDQTIIHATVEPTVADWMKDPDNPNYEALKDVRRFQLMEHNRADWYYIKLRPGTEQFLQTISQYYELHIYTMGTRAYADNIAKIIDPDRKIFADRVLSRDENGTVIQKNLKRLFPVDSKMVVIIDDRGDVWSWIPNLVKVNPFDFFVGIGDINSSFLPKRPGIDDKPKLSKNATEAEAMQPIKDAEDVNARSIAHVSATAASNSNSSPVDQLVSMAGDQSEEAVKEKTREQDDEIVSQQTDRPLLQKQKLLEAAEEEAKTSPAAEAAVELLADDGEKKDSDAPKYRQNLLQDDDNELVYLEKHLINVHRAFFDDYERGLLGAQGGRVADLRPGHGKKRSFDDIHNIPDAAAVMPQMKRQVLRGVHIVFSGVVPLGVNVLSYDTAVWAKSFGATISENITNKTTHVVASPERRTAKVKHALRKGGRIAIVSTQWLFACFREWRRVGVEPFRIFEDKSAVMNGEREGLPEMFKDHSQILSSSEDEAALTEDETDSGVHTPAIMNGDTSADKPGLELDTSEIVEMERHKPTDAGQRDDSSPTETEQQEDWAEINDELAEFMGSDADDLSESNDSDAESTSSSQPRTPTRRDRKRKRGTEPDLQHDSDAPEGTDDDDEIGSRLQKRKKEALSRTTSLANMQKVPSSKGSTPVAAVVDNDAAGTAQADQADDEGEEDDGDLEAMLAAEMERQSDDDKE